MAGQNPDAADWLGYGDAGRIGANEMDDRALEALLRDLESPSSERKQSFADRDRVCQAKVLGYVNRFGRGVPRILESMRKNGSSPPRIEPRSGHFLVVLPRHE